MTLCARPVNSGVRRLLVGRYLSTSMSQFGKTLFGGSRFIFWTLAPVLLLFAVLMPLSTAGWNATKVVLIAGMDAAALLLVFGLYNTKKFWWALRGVTGIVFCLYLVYLIDELIHSSITLKGLLTGESPLEVIKTFIGIGIPCLLYTLVGKFSRREASEGKAGARGRRA
jgi:hypothetical protein